MITYGGLLPFGPYEVKTYTYRDCNGKLASRPVEILRPAEDGGKAIVRWIGLPGAFPVWSARLS